MLPGSFEEIDQAEIGTPKGAERRGITYLRAFVEDVKATGGLVADALKRSGQPHLLGGE